MEYGQVENDVQSIDYKTGSNKNKKSTKAIFAQLRREL